MNTHVTIFHCLGLLLSLTMTGCTGDNESNADSDRGIAPPVLVVEEDENAEPSIEELMNDLGLGANERNRAQKVGGKIRLIDLSKSGISDLSPLAGLQLQKLDLIDNPVKDLSALADMPLEELYAERTKIADLSPLAGSPLKKLYLSATPVKDLSPLQGMFIEELNLNESEIDSLDSIQDMKIGTLWVPHTQISDLTPLIGTDLVSLDVESSKVSSVLPLQKMTTLRRLNLVGCEIDDLTPLKDLALERLLFSPEKVKAGLDAIRGMPTLREVGTNFDTRMPPAQFWASFDAGEL